MDVLTQKLEIALRSVQKLECRLEALTIFFVIHDPVSALDFALGGFPLANVQLGDVTLAQMSAKFFECPKQPLS